MMLLNHIFKKCAGEYKLSNSQEKINYLMYMDNIKLFARIEKELKTLIQATRIYTQDIGEKFRIGKCSTLIMKSRKWHTTHKIVRDFEIQTDHLIFARQSDFLIIIKKSCQIVDFPLPADHCVKLNKKEKKVKYLDLAKELTKTMGNESDGDTNCNWCS